MSLVSCVALVALASCVADAGGAWVEVPVAVAGTDMDAFEVRDGWTVELDRAEVAIGPLYLCASSSSGDLCETARGEMLDTVVVDALDPTPRDVARLLSEAGSVRSVMHDYGITWQLTETAPGATTDAMSGHSVILEGTARKGELEIRFETAVDVTPNREGVLVVRRTIDEHRVAEGDRLVLEVDPRDWLRDVRFDDWVEKSFGESVRFEPNDQAWRAVVVGMTATRRPVLRWER